MTIPSSVSCCSALGESDIVFGARTPPSGSSLPFPLSSSHSYDRHLSILLLEALLAAIQHLFLRRWQCSPRLDVARFCVDLLHGCRHQNGASLQERAVCARRLKSLSAREISGDREQSICGEAAQWLLRLRSRRLQRLSRWRLLDWRQRRLLLRLWQRRL